MADTPSEDPELIPPPAETTASVDDDTTLYDSPQTAAAIDDISAHESDTVLVAQDEAPVPPALERRPLWRRRWFRRVVGTMIFAVLIAVAVTPAARYWALNYAGVRSSATVTVVDNITRQPLQQVRVEAAGRSTYTNSEGTAVLRGLPLGPAHLVITRPGFSPFERQVTIGWGSNPFTGLQLKAIGVQYTVAIVDWLSGKPVPNALVESDTTGARANDKGIAIITVPNLTAPPELAVTVSREGYRTESTTVKASTSAPVRVGLLTSRKAVYISKQSGRYDLYASDADGRNPQVILPATGNENSNISLAVSPDGSQAALVSIRDKQTDADGFPLSTLTLVDVAHNTSTVLTHAQHIQLVDWIGTRLIFQQAGTGGSQYYSVISYDFASNSRYQLAAAAKFNGVLSAQGRIYFVVAPMSGDATVQPYFYRIDPDGANRQALLEKEVWRVIRSGYDTFRVQTSDNWYDHTISTKQNRMAAAPDMFTGLLFVDSVDGKRSLWADAAAGKSRLQLYTKHEGKDTTVHSQTGITYPVRWLTDDSVVYRVVTAGETADYAIGTTGARTPHKIADVVNTFGFSTGQ